MPDWLVSVLYVLAAGAGGSFAAYVDIDNFFRQKKIGITPILRSGSSLTFILANGLIAVGLVWWALESKADSVINAVLNVEEPWAKTLVIALGVPVLLRSRLFTFGDNLSFGINAAYEWVRRGALRKLNEHSAVIKNQIAKQYASRFAGDAEFPEWLQEETLALVNPFTDEKALAKLEGEFANYGERYKTQTTSAVHCEKIIRLALDNAGIAVIESLLKGRNRSRRARRGTRL